MNRAVELTVVGGHETSPAPRTTRSKAEGRTTAAPAITLEIPTTALAMSSALLSLSRELERVAYQLRAKKAHDTIKVPLTLMLMCNSGSDGGDRGDGGGDGGGGGGEGGGGGGGDGDGGGEGGNG